jgi:hypothetical protein
MFLLLLSHGLIACSPSVKKESENVQLYSAGAINRAVHLTRGGMILVALLRGGDYDTVIDPDTAPKARRTK